MIGFGIDQVQAEYVAEIKLRNINKEYILKRVEETESLCRTRSTIWRIFSPVRARVQNDHRHGAGGRRAKSTAEPRTHRHRLRPRGRGVHRGRARWTIIAVTVFLSREGYFKKITPAVAAHVRASRSIKEGDGRSRSSFETTNAAELLFFTDRCQVYKIPPFGLRRQQGVRARRLSARQSSAWTRARASFTWCLPGDYRGSMLFFFENGKAAQGGACPPTGPTSNRRKLTGAYSDKSPLRTALCLREDCELAVYSTEPRVLVFSTALLAEQDHARDAGRRGADAQKEIYARLRLSR